MAAYAHESITVADTAIGFTAAKITQADTLYKQPLKRVIVTVETAQIRFTVDGTTPTDSVGHVLNINDVVYVDGADAASFLAIRTGAVSGAIKATYET